MRTINPAKGFRLDNFSKRATTTSPVTVALGQMMIADATSGPLTVNAPPNPIDGSAFMVHGIGVNLNPVTIDGNGHTIQGASSYAVVSEFSLFMFDAAAGDWVLTIPVQVADLSDGFFVISTADLQAGGGVDSPHAACSITITATPNGGGTANYSVVVNGTKNMSVDTEVTDHTFYITVALALDFPLPNDNRVDFVTLHFDPTAQSAPFITPVVGVAAQTTLVQNAFGVTGNGSTLDIAIDQNAFPLGGPGVIELHYAVFRLK